MDVPNSTPKNIFLADDDIDDCWLFKDALHEVSNQTKLTTAKDGMELMEVLDKLVPPPPDMIFLDVNMPRKDGFECLNEIKLSPSLKNIPIVIFSTSSDREMVDKSYELGANFYISKPRSFPSLKQAIEQMLAFDWHLNNARQPLRENFLLSF